MCTWEDMLAYSDKLAHTQVVINCGYSVAQLCNREDIHTHWFLRAILDDFMSQKELSHQKCWIKKKLFLTFQDTVLMNLYKRMFPKWNYDPHISDYVQVRWLCIKFSLSQLKLTHNGEPVKFFKLKIQDGSQNIRTNRTFKSGIQIVS